MVRLVATPSLLFEKVLTAEVSDVNPSKLLPEGDLAICVVFLGTFFAFFLSTVGPLVSDDIDSSSAGVKLFAPSAPLSLPFCNCGRDLDGDELHH